MGATAEQRDRELALFDQYIQTHVLYDRLPNEKRYIRGSRPLPYLAARLRLLKGVSVIDPGETGIPFEKEVLGRLQNRVDRNITLVVGGTGAGKSTSAWWIRGKLEQWWGATLRRENGTNKEPYVQPPKVLFIDCMNITIGSDLPAAHKALFSTLVSCLRDQVIDAWLRLRFPGQSEFIGDEWPEWRSALGYLLMTSDLFYFSERVPGSCQVHFSGFEPGQRLFKGETLRCPLPDLCRVDPHLKVEYESQLSRIESEQSRVEALARDLLGLAVQHCIKGCRVVVFVDNLDPLATDVIEGLVDSLCRVFEGFRASRLVIPLRASSILAQPNFIRLVDFVVHYGPDCHLLVFERLRHAILGLSRAELSSALLAEQADLSALVPDDDEDDNSPPRPPSERGLDFFICATIQLAWIAWSGWQKANDFDSYVQLVHEDHRGLSRARILPPLASELAGVLAAITGSNARAATLHVSRYYQKVFHDPEPLLRVGDRIRSEGEALRGSRIPAGKVGYYVNAFLLDLSGRLHLARTENLFAPSPLGPEEQPSLHRLFILHFLRRSGTESVDAIARHMARLGVSAEETGAVLMSLHRDERYLVWFSRPPKGGSLEPDSKVTISDRGEHYLENLKVRFDYLWACAAHTAGVNASDYNFRQRLELVSWLISELGRQERQHLLFRRLGQPPGMPEGGPLGSRMHSLELVYLLVADLTASATRILQCHVDEDKAEFGDEYGPGIVDEIDKVVTTLEVCEWFYKVVYGADDYLWLEMNTRSGARVALEGYVGLLERAGVNVSRAARLLDRLRQVDLPEVEAEPLGAMAFVEEGRGIVQRTAMTIGRPLLEKLVFDRLFTGFDEDAEIAASRDAAKLGLADLRDCLENGVPHPSEVVELLRNVAAELKFVHDLIKDRGATTGQALLQPLARGSDELLRLASRLAELAYTHDGPALASEVAVRKDKMRSTLQTYFEIASRLQLPKPTCEKFRPDLSPRPFSPSAR